MFDLNIATLPNSVLYIEGMQLSFIKVYVHIFNLWHSHNPCFISNAEFARRTGLHRDTVRHAIQFFETNGLLRRVQKGSRRYLIQTTQAIETAEEGGSITTIPVDNFSKNCSNIATVSELDPPTAESRPPLPLKVDPHNKELNLKDNKSFSASPDQKANSSVDNSKPPRSSAPSPSKNLDRSAQRIANEIKHDFANRNNQPRSTVPFWGPGHPSWESIYGEQQRKSQ